MTGGCLVERLLIEQTKSTPAIDFDAQNKIMAIRGESYPENAFKFYEPVLGWLNDFLSQVETDGTIQMNLNLPYFNTSSSKCLMMILEKLEEAHNLGKQIVVNWYYDRDNESELECAEEFKEFVDLTFNIIPAK